MQTTEVPVSLATLLGGEAMKVKLRDGSETELFVRALPLRLIGKWSALDSNGSIEAESELVESLYCDKPKGFADTLTIESFEAVLAKGDELNRPIFVRWQQRQASRTREWLKAAEVTTALRRELGLPDEPSPTSPQNSASSSDDSQPK